MRGTAERDVQELVTCLKRAHSNGAALGLDLRPLDEGNASARRIGPWWTSSVTNLLAGYFSELPLRIALPAARSVQLQLLRGGLYHALAQRPRHADYSESSDFAAGALRSSAGAWAPRKGAVLFEEAPGTPVSERSYLYANTHERAEPGYFRRYQGSAAFPFLGQIIPRPRARAGREAHQMFLVWACQALAEVLDNFSTHAFNRLDASFDADWLGPMIVDRARSCLLVGVTTGGTDSCDRLHFTALDNGFGIPRTMRWQHPKPLRSTAAADIVECVLRERLTARNIDGHAGGGLWCLYVLSRFAGGTIWVTTEDDQSDGQSATRVQLEVPAFEAGDQSPKVKTNSTPLPWRGTTIHAQIRIPRLEETDERQLRELRDRLHRYSSVVPQSV